MTQTVSFTIHPSPLDGELLTVSDAMRQVLDLVEALEKIEGGERKIVWRLSEAHTNSPPFTVTAMATAAQPSMAIGTEAARVTRLFASAMDELLLGKSPQWLDAEVTAPLKRIMKRNLNGISQTDILVGNDEKRNLLPTNAKTALAALERASLEATAAAPDYRRTEYGTIESEVTKISRWNDKPALIVIERLSEKEVTCVLSNELAEKLGPERRWVEVWDGRRLLVGGILHYDSDGTLKKIDAEYVEELPWADVNLDDLREVDILEGRTVSQHLEKLWGNDDAKAH